MPRSTDEENADDRFNLINRAFMTFKRFDQLAAQSLVYMQMELADLQGRLDKMDDKDERYQESGEEDSRRQCLKSWAAIRAEVEAGNKGQSERFNLIMEIRSKLNAYRMLTLLKTNRRSVCADQNPRRSTTPAGQYNESGYSDT